MKLVKVRRVGNSNVVTLPAELEDLGFSAGSTAVIEPQEDGSLRIVAVDLHEYIAQAAKKSVQRNRKALAILEAHDKSKAATASGRR